MDDQPFWIPVLCMEVEKRKENPLQCSLLVVVVCTRKNRRRDCFTVFRNVVANYNKRIILMDPRVPGKPECGFRDRLAARGKQAGSSPQKQYRSPDRSRTRFRQRHSSQKCPCLQAG